MNNNITYDEAQIRRDACTAEVIELLKKWRREKSMQGINWDILNQDKAKNEGEELANEHLNPDERKIYELSVKEFKELMVDCFEMWKQMEMDTSVKEYDKITTKPIKIEEVFVKDGKTVPQEY